MIDCLSISTTHLFVGCTRPIGGTSLPAMVGMSNPLGSLTKARKVTDRRGIVYCIEGSTRKGSG